MFVTYHLYPGFNFHDIVDLCMFFEWFILHVNVYFELFSVFGHISIIFMAKPHILNIFHTIVILHFV